MNIQTLILKLQAFWQKQGCTIVQSYDLEKGAGTFNPATFLRVLGPKPWYVAYVERTRRPSDGRYGVNPYRLQHYYQFQVIMKPAPIKIQQKYIYSLKYIGFNYTKHDIKFIEDNWEAPTLGACGMGWEVRINGMEVTQFTYFQQICGINLDPVSVEVTYGIERIAMCMQRKNNIYDLQWSDNVTYGDMYLENEKQWSSYNFEHADISMLKQHFNDWEKEAYNLIKVNLPIPAYDAVMKCSHLFNLLDARNALSVSERMDYILRVRKIVKYVVQKYITLN
ncbi:MAG: glycine--tRNA ligase subunit alpha [Endomicrobium sp.]|jgi:glycyl-tRNA synthetase alpha chain|nr:glycine--tRNA ligase subunit alpha [Endomicrobium sp.]